jgi:DNA glycosylase AlkZ-like
MSVPERRARLGRRHHLAPSAHADSPVAVARDLVALHGTDPATVFLSIVARTREPTVAAIEDALYLKRELVRMLGMRRTMFVVPDALAPVVQAACTRAIAVQMRRRYQQFLGDASVVDRDDVASWWISVENATLVALERRGEATAQELGQDVPELRTQLRLAEGKSYAGTQSVATWMLMQLSAEGKIVRGRPRGSWISSQYRWAPIDAWLPSGLFAIDTPAAQVALIGEWLRGFGPGSLADVKWWTGLTVGEVKRALQALDVVEVDLGETTGLVLADDVEPEIAPEAWAALLPALDVTPMAYLQRDWFLGPRAAALFDRSGNIGPTVWCDGRIVGGWAQRSDGVIALKLLEDVGAEAEARVAAEAHALEAWLGGTRVTPRFRTPLERELSA